VGRASAAGRQSHNPAERGNAGFAKRLHRNETGLADIQRVQRKIGARAREAVGEHLAGERQALG